jgi:hypothetical protein
MEFSQENTRESDEDEIDRYIKAKLIINTEKSVLTWWKKWAITYPKLSLLAMSLFSIPASSRTSERIFTQLEGEERR